MYEDVNLNQSSLFFILKILIPKVVDVKFWSMVEKMFNFFATI
jgi:hypothetical protein